MDKTQGLTLKSCIITNLRSSKRRALPKTIWYVAVSRVKSLSNLILQERLTLNYLKFFTPLEKYIEETRRLELIATDIAERYPLV